MDFSKVAFSLAAFAIVACSAAVMDEDIFNTSKETGMTPGVPSEESGVRTPLAGAGTLANAAGTWSLTLTDKVTRDLNLTLSQNDDAVFGYGNISVSGNSTPVSAGGSLAGNVLSLYVIPWGDPSLYIMSLEIGPASINGDYEFITLGGSPAPGVAFGQLVQAGAAPARTVIIGKTTSTTGQEGEGQSSTMPKGPKGSGV